MKTRPEIRRAAAVLRVSSAGQADPEKDSIPAQRRLAEEWCAAEGWELVAVYDETADKGYQSGRDRMNDRPYIQRMLRDAEAGAFDVVIFREPSRLGRDDVEALVLGRDLRDRGVLVGFSWDRKVADIEDRHDKLLFYIGQWQAEVDWSYLTRRMYEGKIAAARRGRWPSGPVPYGYRLTEDGRLDVHEAEAEVIRDAFGMIAKGIGVREVAERLNNRHERPRRRGGGDGFTHGLVRAWLHQDAYVGRGYLRRFNAAHGTEEVRIPCPAVLDLDLWTRARRAYEERAETYYQDRRRPDQWRQYPLTGHLFHREADGHLERMSGSPRTSSREKHRTYKCVASHTGDCGGFATWQGKRRTAIRADRFEAEVVLSIIERIETPDALDTWREERRAHAREQASIVGDREHIESKLGDLGARRERILTLYEKGHIDEGTLDARMADVSTEEESLRRALAEIEEAESVADLGESWLERIYSVTVGFDWATMRDRAKLVLAGDLPSMDPFMTEWLTDVLDRLSIRVIIERDPEDPDNSLLTFEGLPMGIGRASRKRTNTRQWLWEVRLDRL